MADVVGVIGANGAGKTTFINMVTGYLVPSAGTIHFDGRDITGLAPRDIVCRGLGRSFQIPQLFGSLTARENMLVALGIASPDGMSWRRPLRRPVPRRRRSRPPRWRWRRWRAGSPTHGRCSSCPMATCS